jgi:hypothetical protein
MALGDGTGWDETLPTDATSAVQIDDHNRDLRKGIRLRMANEHEWPGSQSATSEAGQHKFITFQSQAAKPTLAGTQVNAIYASTDNLYFEKSDGTVVQIVAGTAVGDGKVLANSTDAVGGYLNQKLDANHLVLSGTNVQISATAIDFRHYGTSHSTPATTGIRNLIVCAGIATMASGTVVISGLPFANANYGVGALQFSAGDIQQAITINSKAAGSFRLRDINNGANQIQWMAVGI